MPKTRHERYQDHVERLVEEIHSHLSDPPTVNRLLIELRRMYDPLLDGGVVDPFTHRQIVDLLRIGKIEEARRILDQRIALHNRFTELKQEMERSLTGSEPRSSSEGRGPRV
jgi:hypothetical protein